MRIFQGAGSNIVVICLLIMSCIVKKVSGSRHSDTTTTVSADKTWKHMTKHIVLLNPIYEYKNAKYRAKL